MQAGEWSRHEGKQPETAMSESRTVSIILDAITANITVFAISSYAGDREAHVREVEQLGETSPPA
jgi:hypothetical protein